MNKSGVFFVIFLLLLGITVVPTGPANYAVQPESSSAFEEAAFATSGTLKIPVVENTGVGNGTNADTNFGGDPELYCGTADDSPWIAARSWFKFDLTHLPRELSVERATMNVFVVDDYTPTAGADEPTGVYYCEDDSWEQMVITWNLQPAFSATPTSVIDSPASPNMIVPMNWYSWDVTPDVRNTVAGDKILSEVLKFTTEVGTANSFFYPAKSEVYPFYATYLEIEYTTPTTIDVAIDGISSGPLLDYINNPTPDVSWTFSDPDYNDFQKDYDIELWNNTYYNETMLWQASHEQISVIYESPPDDGNTHPFGNPYGFRMQMKYPGSEFPRSGIVDKLYFTSTNQSGDMQVENLEISLLLVPSTAALTSDFYANYEGGTPTVVLSRDLYEGSVIDYVLEIDVEDTFFLNEYLNLIIEIRLTNNTGDMIKLARIQAPPGSVATNTGDSEATTSDYEQDRTYDLKIGFLTTEVFKGSEFDNNGFPFGTTVGYSGRFQVKYNQSYINRAGYLDRIFIRGTSFDDVVFENFSLTVVETPVLGPITNGTWVENYGGATATVVLDESMYTVRNVGLGIVIDFDNTFYYSNTHDLLFDIQWDSLVSGSFRVSTQMFDTSSYRAWDLHYGFVFLEGSELAGYDLLIDFVNSEDSVPMEGCPTLVDGTWYYLRARTCDSFGTWSDWTTLNFKYEVISELPSFTSPVAVPDPARVGQEVTISLNTTHSLGIYEVSIEFDGTNHTMAAVGDTFSYTWTPTTAETVNYTIYIQSNANTWNSVDGSLVVQPVAGGLGDMTLILVIGSAAVVVVVTIIVVLKRRPAKK